ncbi:septum formation inhibitor Maf [Saccharobesus litoralis]|uniref:7-methyl-GTP pyrophosphatase n=1 Tax=Saccharobesus litoralis TaxID=2172099 RepID=A0A2S0VPE5_9ALTE|nr:Maf family protein [Saccharobesus litoralis]AWB65960.1 septum formation inhibitor Maf [Saccharobesus litoralis]
MSQTSIILASTSPYRKQILEKLQLPFDTAKPHVDETPLENESASALVERLALLKAQAVAKNTPNAIVIGSDQVAVIDNKILGKPGNFENAVKQLQQLNGKTVTFLTGLSVQWLAKDLISTQVVPFEVEFRELSLEEIKAYLNKEQPYNCAGSFKSEALGISLFNALRGDDPNTLMGLPLIALTKVLREFGVNPLTDF